MVHLSQEMAHYGMSNATNTLIALIQSPEDVARVQQECHRFNPVFPEFGAGTFVWRMLFVAGMPIPRDTVTDRQFRKLLEHGWRVMPEELDPNPGDIYIVLDEHGHVIDGGFAHKGVRNNTDWFWSVDAESPEGGRRRRDMDVVAHWLRYG
jgi:hypothetical protein